MRAVRPTALLVGERFATGIAEALIAAGLRPAFHDSFDSAALEHEPAHVIVAAISNASQLPALCRLCEVSQSPRLIVLSDCLPTGAGDILARVTRGRYRSLRLHVSADTIAGAARDV
jgi:hypothetical protein